MNQYLDRLDGCRFFEELLVRAMQSPRRWACVALRNAHYEVQRELRLPLAAAEAPSPDSPARKEEGRSPKALMPRASVTQAKASPEMLRDFLCCSGSVSDVF